jgi:NAD(P)H-dependent FMN reductase
VVVSGSVRIASNTGRVAALMGEVLRARGAVVDDVDPRGFPLLVPGVAGQEAEAAALTADLQQRVRASAGVILVTPEYDGSYSAVLKVLIEHLGYPSVLAGKPVAIVGVASGRVGAARAVDHLRGLCLHIGAIVLPRPRSLAVVHRLFDDQGRCVDAATAASLTAAAEELAMLAEKLARPFP